MLKGEIPFVRMLIPLIVGIVIGLLWPGKGLMITTFTAALFGLLCLCLFIGLYKNLNLYRRRWIYGILIHFILLFLGTFLTIRSAEKFDRAYFSHHPSDALIVTVNNEPQLSGNLLRFQTTVDQSVKGDKINAVSGKLLIAFKIDFILPLRLVYGDRLLIPSRYYDVDPPFNPAEFNYKSYLASKQLYKQTFLNQEDVRVLKRNTGNQVISFALALRQRLVRKFYNYLEDQEAALASTLILGYRSNLSKEVISAYSKTGTMHILSVSGMHVAIVFLVLAILMRPLRRNKSMRLLSALIIISSIWFYALLTGFSPSVCRAAMMLSFIVLGKTLNKNLNTYNLLAISAFFLLIYYPYNLVDIGFQLSYLAVFGLVYLQPKIYQLLQLKNKILDYLWSYSALSISAQLATFPISVYYFHQFPVYFLVSNLLVVLPVALLMYAGIAFLFIPWTIILNPLGNFLNSLIFYTNRTLFNIEDLPFSSIGGIWLSTFQYLLIYLIIILLIWSASHAKKFVAYLCLGSISLLMISKSFQSIKNSRNKELIFYSLRKNSAIAYIENRKAYLISDLGNDEKTRLFSVMPAMESRGIQDIERVEACSQFSSDKIKVSSFYMQFGKYRVIRWSKELDNAVFSGTLESDMVLLSGNPRIKIAQLKENIKFSVLIIDGTNADYRINQWKAEADVLNIPVRILKKQPAYVLRP